VELQRILYLQENKLQLLAHRIYNLIQEANAKQSACRKAIGAAARAAAARPAANSGGGAAGGAGGAAAASPRKLPNIFNYADELSQNIDKLIKSKEKEYITDITLELFEKEKLELLYSYMIFGQEYIVLLNEMIESGRFDRSTVVRARNIVDYLIAFNQKIRRDIRRHIPNDIRERISEGVQRKLIEKGLAKPAFNPRYGRGRTARQRKINRRTRKNRR
jgi:hypothetical protein